MFNLHCGFFETLFRRVHKPAREQGRTTQLESIALTLEAVSKVATFRELATNARIKTKTSLIYSCIRG